MEISTETPRLETLRRGVLDLWLSTLPEGAVRPDPEGDELAVLLHRYGVARSSFGHTPGGLEVEASHPYLRFDPSRCIVCRRCLHACEDVQGQFVFGVEGRGVDTRLAFGETNRFAESSCTACGACVDACPSGALHDVDRLEGGPAGREVRSTCGYCGVGCGVEIATDGARVLRIRGARSASVNAGHLCAKGRYAHGYQRSSDRLTRPLLGEPGKLEPVSWEEALGWLAGRLREIREHHGADSLGAFTSSRSTNEAAYLLQKLFRGTLGTNNVDCCARVCHASTALALQAVTGTGAASASYADIEGARCIVGAGANPTEAHPVVGARLKQAVLRGVPLIVIDPRRIELAELARVHLALRPGTNVAVLNGLARGLVDVGGVDADYVAARTEGFEALREHLAGLSLDAIEEVSGVDADSLLAAARVLREAGPTLFVHGLGLSELTQGTDSVMALCNLGMLTGSIGHAGAGMLPLRGQNNVQGNADMGSLPNLVTGYQRLDAPDVRARVEGIWGRPLPQGPGLTIPRMLERAGPGGIRALWIQGEDVAQSDPDQTRVIEALERLELLVVQEILPSETTPYAHLVLPAAGALEQDGTFTNGERRIQRVRSAVPPPGDARADWEAVRDLARTFGEPWAYEHPSDVMDEIARVAPSLFGGVSYGRLEPDGLQWPCPTPEHPGTASVHTDGFLRGRGRLVVIDHVPSPAHDVEGYPYLLVTGRVLHHYNVGTMTRRTPSLELAAEDRLEIHPSDAAREGIEERECLRVESRFGASTLRACLSQRVRPGTLFLSFHFPGTHTNRLVGPHLDPQSDCPEYKVTAVRLVTGATAGASEAQAAGISSL
jgi:formate dehydrogenase alpha subunit